MDLNEETPVTLAAEQKTYTMQELRATDASLYIRNDTPLMWTLHDKVGTGAVHIELRPAGQKGSITYLPAYALDAPGIARNMSHHKITVSPHLEQEMLDLDTGASNTVGNLLDRYKVTVETSPQSRAMDVRSSVDANMQRAAGRQGITPQGLQNGRKTVIDEFINPSPIAVGDGRFIDPMTGEESTPEGAAAVDPMSTEIKSVTITRPARIPEEGGQ